MQVHDQLYFQFLLCEILNLVVDIVNIYLTDFFLSGRFMKWGLDMSYRNTENDGDNYQIREPGDGVSQLWPGGQTRQTQSHVHRLPDSHEVDKC